MPERLEPSNKPEWRQYGHQHLQRYRFALQQIEGKRLLDLACGVGYGSYVLAQAHGRDVTGIDLDASAIAYGKSHYNREGLRLINADALLWENDGEPFDSVVSFETIEHLPSPVEFVARVAKLIKSGGIFVVSAPNILQHKGAPEPIHNPWHLNEPDYATLCSWLRPHFTIESEWEQSRVVPVGLESLGTVRRELDAINRRWWLRAANRIESFLRGGAPDAPSNVKKGNALPMVSFTEIVPLLPERRNDCDVFLFVCRRS
jgi:SAM-dependent methyltransferase